MSAIGIMQLCPFFIAADRLITRSLSWHQLTGMNWSVRFRCKIYLFKIKRVKINDLSTIPPSAILGTPSVHVNQISTDIGANTAKRIMVLKYHQTVWNKSLQKIFSVDHVHYFLIAVVVCVREFLCRFDTYYIWWVHCQLLKPKPNIKKNFYD